MYTYTDIAAACFVNRWLVKKERTFRIIATTNSNYIWYYETLYIDMFELIFCICITISEIFVGSFTLNVLKLCCQERTFHGWKIVYTNNLQFLINYTNYNVSLGMIISNIKQIPYIWGGFRDTKFANLGWICKNFSHFWRYKKVENSKQQQKIFLRIVFLKMWNYKKGENKIMAKIVSYTIIDRIPNIYI